MKRQKKSYKKSDIKTAGREGHEILASSLHSSLLCSLGVQLGKEKKFCSGESCRLCNYLGVGCSPVRNKSSFSTGGCLPSFEQASQWTANRLKKPDSVQMKDDLMLRWAEEETYFPEWP